MSVDKPIVFAGIIALIGMLAVTGIAVLYHEEKKQVEKVEPIKVEKSIDDFTSLPTSINSRIESVKTFSILVSYGDGDDVPLHSLYAELMIANNVVPISIENITTMDALYVIYKEKILGKIR
jgi:hypothetical protein